MEKNEKGSTAKTVLLVFGIIFSVILMPGLIFGIPAGGVLISLSEAASQKGIETMAKEAKLSENLHRLFLDEASAEIQDNVLKQEFWMRLLQDNITVETVDGILSEAIDCMYNGTEPELSFREVTEGFLEDLEELEENGFRDLYATWTDGAESAYFSQEFVQSFRQDIESSLLNDFPEYGAASLDELEVLYDAQYGEGAFSGLIEEKTDAFEESWKESFDTDIRDEFENMTEELELEFNEGIYEAAQDSEVRSVFDSFNKISAKSGRIKWIVSAIVIGAVLLLLVCYWFKTAGFVVPAVALILGGLLCNLLTLMKNGILKYADKLIAAEPELKEVEAAMQDVFRGILTPVFEKISGFGMVMIGSGVLLILLAILKNVGRKSFHASE